MRSALDTTKLLAFMDEIGCSAESAGRVYFVGGATALLLGIREQTIDIDIKLDPEPKGIFERIAILKERLEVNVELSYPDQFIPALPGWRERSEFIRKVGSVEFYHYDFYGQALAKILRGHRTDRSDARALVKLGRVDMDQLLALYRQIRPELIRYPAIRATRFDENVESFVKEDSP